MFNLFSLESLWNDNTAISALIVNHEDLISRIRNLDCDTNFYSIEEFRTAVESIYPEAANEIFDYEWEQLYVERQEY